MSSNKKQIDVEGTIISILNAQRIGVSVNEKELRAKVQKLENPENFLLECAEMVRAQVVYVEK